jgi:hypothetical protein
VLLALIERQASGRGQLIDVGMHDCLAVSAELANLFWFYPRVEVQRQTVATMDTMKVEVPLTGSNRRRTRIAEPARIGAKNRTRSAAGGGVPPRS